MKRWKMLSRVIAHVMLQELKSLVFALQSQKSQKALDAILNRWKRNAQRFSFFFLNMREGPFTFSQAKQIDTHTHTQYDSWYADSFWIKCAFNLYLLFQIMAEHWVYPLNQLPLVLWAFFTYIQTLYTHVFASTPSQWKTYWIIYYIVSLWS